MAIAPPPHPDVDIVVVAARERNPLDALALLRYLQSVTPEIVVMIGAAWVSHFTKVDSFKDALLADRLEQLAKCGARLYIVDPQCRSNLRIELPRGRKVEVRRELQLRVEGRWVLFGAHADHVPTFERLRTWTRAWFGGARQQPEVSADSAFAKTVFARTAFAKTVSTLAEERKVETVVLDLPEALLRRIEKRSGEGLTLASPGFWSTGHGLLEHRYGQWVLTDAARHRVSDPRRA